MRKDIALKLKTKAKQIAEMYSNAERERNVTNEIFTVHKIIPTSEFTAAVVLSKEPSKKQAMAICLWINQGNGYWHYFLPTDSHLLGLRYMEKIKQQIEEFNYDKN